VWFGELSKPTSQFISRTDRIWAGRTGNMIVVVQEDDRGANIEVKMKRRTYTNDK
jgi:hypothetical protein